MADILSLPGATVPILGKSKQIDMDVITEVMDALSNVFAHLKATDDANAAANCADTKFRPLTMKVAVAAGRLAEAAGLAEVQESQ